MLRPGNRNPSWLLSLALMLVVLGCQKVPPQDSVSSSGASSRLLSSSSHDLSRDEAEGGHTLRKHVGKTDDELRLRLEEQPEISAASTYTDRATAEVAVATACQENRGKIERWLEGNGSHRNLVLEYDSAQPLGRTLDRGKEAPRACSHAVIILRWLGHRQYYVLTSYPECR